MIVVKVELHSARTGLTTELGRMLISNDGTGTTTTGNYDVRVAKKGVTDNQKIRQKPQRQGRVVGHKRQSLSIWSLVARALQSVRFE